MKPGDEILGPNKPGAENETTTNPPRYCTISERYIRKQIFPLPYKLGGRLVCLYQHFTRVWTLNLYHQSLQAEINMKGTWTTQVTQDFPQDTGVMVVVEGSLSEFTIKNCEVHEETTCPNQNEADTPWGSVKPKDIS